MLLRCGARPRMCADAYGYGAGPRVFQVTEAWREDAQTVCVFAQVPAEFDRREFP